ncbi:MAG: hypothetical protein ACD_51C00028G0024 [uncultured bacterium]|nr:MAG: hypothetical protein ACD_51C00028G0024 [uncultured bacterium]OGJ47888.1 MAG: hypothetical protein A2244_05415 [Candidatus Peregrinibacteria bacterium RIFOXYA2_FULL_41_18]OGJ49133.1 MAG: hypothetical protein A2344_01000 [Candidatus Peregrinibacteria bacterium RIFOXYB12_FULL_41_12]OGJ52473.1 MAG: hypothetical protein A2336_01440 [Candidatus Peregrinibacteria bacterium RIFOXYB2_FULL_41_88]OGJ53311.1 MAG: hypothetical protein A2448_01450 [Candidatus Peregrinibacteria bacterium RIFOXYC2_FULL
MKKLLIAICGVAILLTSGCSLFAMDEMTYYNTYIDYINPLAEQLDNGYIDYINTVPENATADMEIDFYGSYYMTAIADLADARASLFTSDMIIPDTTKQTALEAATNSYFDSFEVFFEKYNEAATYYGNDTYKTNIEYALELDNAVIDSYYNALDLQNTLFELISEYQVSARGELNEDTTDPVEKIGVSITLLSDKVDEILDVLNYWDFVNPDVAGLTSLYDGLVAKHQEEKTELDAITTDEYKSLIDTFNSGYLSVLTGFEVEVKKLIDDANAGLVTEENSADYNIVFDYYDQLIDAHNSTIDLLEMQ